MRLKSKLILFATLWVVMLLSFSCSDNEGNGINPPEGPTQPVFSTKIDLPVNASTRVDGNKWEVDDEVGIYMVYHNQTLPSGLVTGVANRRYKIESAGVDAKDALKPATSDDEIYFPMDASTVDFIAYYPYKQSSELVNYKYPIDLRAQATSSNHDLLYSTGGSGNSHNNAVSLSFIHVLSNITLDITRGHGITDDKFQNKVVTVNGMPATASFFLGDGSISDIGSVSVITAGSKNVANTLYEIIILPQEIDTYKGRYLNVLLDSKNYQWYIPDGTYFEQGKRYTYQLTLTANGLEMIDFNIEPWQSVPELSSGSWQGGSEIKFKPEDIERVRIPAGTFWMGSPDGNLPVKIGNKTFIPANDPHKYGSEQPIHEVQISKDFYFGKYPVTCKQYCYFLNSFRSDPNFYVDINGTSSILYKNEPGEGWLAYVQSNPGYPWTLHYNQKTNVWSPSFDAITGIDYSDYPVGCVTWYGANAFCEWVGGRLPTEAEWEYAARGGRYFETYTDGALPIRWDIVGGTSSYANLGDYAWLKDNNTTDGNVHGPKPVGEKLPSTYGLYDMHGNVWEYCYDWHSATYYSTFTNIAVDPTGPTTSEIIDMSLGKNKILRGGDYNETYRTTRSAYRGSNGIGVLNPDYGFRVLFPL